MKYTITTSNGIVFTDLEKNGDNYTSKEKLDISAIENKMLDLIISNNENELEEHLENMKLIQQMEIKGEYYICFRQVTKEELEKIKNRSDIEYIAMMSDVDLEV